MSDGKVNVDGVFFHFFEFYFAFVKKNLTAKDILNCENAEKRAVLINHYGYEFILQEFKHKIIDEEEVKSHVDGKMCKHRVIDIEIADGVWHRILDVECPSTHKKTFLGVVRDDSTMTCDGARASTFRIEVKKFKPKYES